MSAEAFVAAARALIGTKWRHRGRKPWAVDCLGLLVLSAQAAGRQLQDESFYGRDPWDDRLRMRIREEFGAPVAENWRSGDVALIRWRGAEPSHVAILADHPDGGLSMIHAHNLHGVVEHRLSGEYLAAVEEVYRPWPVKSFQ